MITFEQKGDFHKTFNFFERIKEVLHLGLLDKYGRQGVEALREATPRDTGKTADSWTYEIQRTQDGASIIWKNDNINDGIPIAILLQYGHGTGTGGWVEGIDYINPAIRPVFDEIAEAAWKEVTRA